MDQFTKHFTLEEARALLPRLRVIFGAIHKHKPVLEETETKLGRELSETGGDVGGADLSRLLGARAALQDAMTEIEELGIQVKDVDRGLVDFPSRREGREIFLCWEIEEDDIEFWHDLESGYAGRERL